MFSKYCRHLLKRCSHQLISPRIGSKTFNKFDLPRGTFVSSYSSSSTLFSSKAPGGGNSSDDSDDSGDEAPEDQKITEDMYILPDEKDLVFKAGVATPEVEELTPEEEEEALEARKRYYAKKVSGIIDEEPIAPAQDYIPRREKKIDDLGRSYGTGRRKTSVARVWIKDGSGLFEINNRRLIDYFTPIARETCLGAFIASKTVGLFDVYCTVKGGGTSGQSGAIRLGVARALEAYDPHYRKLLAPAGMLSRDSRRVERKKPGQKKARKQFQWVKR